MSFTPSSIVGDVRSWFSRIEGETRKDLEAEYGQLEDQIASQRDRVMQELADEKLKIITEAEQMAPGVKSILEGELNALEAYIARVLGGEIKSPTSAQNAGEAQLPLT